MKLRQHWIIVWIINYSISISNGNFKVIFYNGSWHCELYVRRRVSLLFDQNDVTMQQVVRI